MGETIKKICRICLYEIEENAQLHIINDGDLKLKSKLLEFVPELDLSCTPNSIACQSCTGKIQQMHEFKQMCLRTDIIVKNVNDSFLKRITMKVEDTIKEELFDLEIVNDKLIEYNTDIPKIIEESNCSKYSSYNTNQHSPARPFKCDQCDYSTEQDQNLAMHKLAHSEENLKCTQCSYKTKRLSLLKSHLLTHTDEKPFKCDTCGHRTKYKHNLITHFKTHPDKKRFQCGKCSFVTNESILLKKHLIKHSLRNPSKCDQCDFISERKQTVIIHKRIHTSEKPFKCTQCDYRSTQLTHLNYHLLTHAKKLFKCNQCGFRTKHKGSLKKHLNKHAGKK